MPTFTGSNEVFLFWFFALVINIKGQNKNYKTLKKEKKNDVLYLITHCYTLF